MGLVLWIDRNVIATALFERVFKERGLPFYTLSEAKDFTYLIEDLSPALIVLEGQTALQCLERVKEQYESSQGFKGCPVVLLGPVPELGFIQNVVGTLKLPINPFSLPETLQKML